MSDIKIIRGNGEADPQRAKFAEALAKKTAPGLKRGTLNLAENLKNARGGSYQAMANLKESLSQADFPFLFNQLVNYGVINQYAQLPSVWQTFMSRTTVTDFRPQRMRQWYEDVSQLPEQNGGEPRVAIELPRIPELSEYPTFTLAAEEMGYGIAKYGKRFPFSWEVFINDELQVIADMPNVMATTAAHTEDILAVRQLAGPDGINPKTFNTEFDFGTLVPRGNILENNPKLSVEALEKAFENVSLRRVNGNIVTVNSWTLVVPPSLGPTAARIASMAEYTVHTPMPNGTTQEITWPNPVRGRFTIVENPWLAVVDTSDTMATSWYLVPSGGSDGVNRSLIMSFLAGDEAPEVRINNDTGSAIGGGQISALRGSFSHDDVQFRVRHVLGANAVNPAPLVASHGNDEPTNPS